MKRFLLTTLALLSAAAIAAPQPTSGTFGDATGPLSFDGGPFYVPNPASDSVYLADPPDQPHEVLVCKKRIRNCDRFALTVALSENLRASAVEQKQFLNFSLHVQEQQPLPVVKPEFHFYLFDASGKELARSDFGADRSPEYHFDLPLKSVPNGSYTVIVTGYNGLGARYFADIGLGAGE